MDDRNGFDAWLEDLERRRRGLRRAAAVVLVLAVAGYAAWWLA